MDSKLSLEELTEKERIDQLGYTSYDSFLSINRQIKTILEKVVEDSQNKIFDAYMYGSALNLGFALLSVKGKYERNGIKIKGKEIFSYKDLKLVLPDLFWEDLQPSKSSDFLERRIFDAAEYLIQGIETEMSQLPIYDEDQKSKNLKKTVEKGLKNVKKYADLCAGLSDILIDLGKEKEADIIRGCMDRLSDSEGLMKKIKDKKSSNIINSIICVHSELCTLPYNGNVNPFIGKTGEQIEWAMKLTETVMQAKDSLINIENSGKKKFMNVLRSDSAYIERYVKETLEDLEKYGLADVISESIIDDDGLEDILTNTDAPFSDLETQMHSLGIPYELAIKVKDYLSANMFSRGLTGFLEMEEKECYQMLFNLKKEAPNRRGNDRYAEAIKLLVEDATGVKTNEFSLKSYNDEYVNYSDSIANWINVTKVTKKGNVKKVYEAHAHQDLESMLESLQNQFRDEKYEIYVTKPGGICFIFDYAWGYTPKTDFRTSIEIRDCFENLTKNDKTAGLIYLIQLMAHETTHAAQINSKLIWKEIAARTIETVSKVALELHKKGVLDYEVSSDSGNLKRREKNKYTNKRELIDSLDEEIGQALGIGKFAENCRKKGVYDALVDKGAVLRNDGSFNPKYFSRLELENSRMSRLAKQARAALLDGDMKKLSRIRRKAESYSEEINVIIETMADTFGLVATKKFIENYPGRMSKEKRGYYFGSLENKLVREGKDAKIIYELISDYRDDPNKMEDELNKRGFTYKKIIMREDQESVKADLRTLRYNPIDTLEAYDNMDRLKRRIRSHNSINKRGKKRMVLKKLLFPVNTAEAKLSLRYTENIPLFLDVVDKYGSHKAYELISDAESIKGIKKLLD